MAHKMMGFDTPPRTSLSSQAGTSVNFSTCSKYLQSPGEKFMGKWNGKMGSIKTCLKKKKIEQKKHVHILFIYIYIYMIIYICICVCGYKGFPREMG